MAIKITRDSDQTTLSIAEEESLRVLPSTPVWQKQEPNSYNNFGGDLTLVSRRPIAADRQIKKGNITDLDASGGIEIDITQLNAQDLLQGVMFADYRTKGEAKNPIGVTTLLFAATTTGSLFTRSGVPALDLTLQFSVGDTIFVSGFSDEANNGLFKVSAVTATTITAADADGTNTAATLVDEAATGTVSIIQVGTEATVADIDVDASLSLPALTSTTLDFTTLGLIPGEWIFIGGDATINQFATAANNTRARVRSVTATRLVLDKTETTMVTETGTGLLIQLFMGRVLKNEIGSLIKRRTYQLERDLGAPDSSFPALVESEYLVGCGANEFNFAFDTAALLTASIDFVGLDNEQRTTGDGLKSGTRPALVEADGFNTSSDIRRIKLSQVSSISSNPDPLFAFPLSMELNINNNMTSLKALGALGGIEFSTGTFEVTGSLEVYFSSIESVLAVRNNADITLDAHLYKDNSGFAIDVPLLALGGGRLDVVQNEAITLSLDNNAATGAKIDSSLNHTLLLTFYNYLPTLAQ